ncbi:LOG family protein [bacterium]|jgi:uncharacterized protein (TIGR00730 family)|nr:LOG family protein [bacterium]
MLNEDIKSTIKHLITKIGSRDSELYLNDLLMTVSRMALEDTDSDDWKLAARAMKEFRKSFKVFSPYRDVRKVCIFGSARTPEDHPEFKLAEDFAKAVTEKDFMVITGAGGGIMEAGNKGALPDMHFGVNIELPFEQEPNPYINDDPKLISYKYFFIRKLMFIKESDATVLLPGGFGTLDEGYEGLTLMQTGKSEPRPVVLLETEGADYWEKFVQYFYDVMIPQGYISPEDVNMFTICNNVEDAVKAVTEFYKYYHSVRYVREMTVMRFNVEVPDHILNMLNTDYIDLLKDGKFERCEPYEEEKMSRDKLRLPRLHFHFDKHKYGRLLQMIKHINTLDW